MMHPTLRAPSDDLFLRRVAWWLCGTILYLQLLSLSKLLGNVFLTSAPLVFAVVWLIWRWCRSRSLTFSRAISLDLLAVILIAAVIFFLRAIQPPRGFDVLAYHLPYIVEWMRHGWAIPFYSAFSGAVGYYPGNLELLALPFLSLTSSAYLLNAINVFSFLLMLGVIWALAKKIGVSSSLAVFFFAALMFTSEGTLKNLGNAYNDIFLAATLLAAWYFAEQYFTNRRLADLCLSGLMAGLAVGTRYAGVLYVLVFVVYFAFRVRRVGALSILLLTILLPSVYWYARNFAMTGSPFYPQELTLFGLQVFPGIDRANGEQLLILHLFDRQYMRLLLRALFINGHVLLLPLLVLFPLRKFFRRELHGYWIAGLICLMLYLVTPLSAEDYNHVYLNYRYALPFQWFVLTAGSLALLAALPTQRIAHWLEQHPLRLSYPLAAILLTATMIFGYSVYQRNYVKCLPRSNPKLGHSWAFIETLPPSRIAHAGWDVSGALYGSHFQHSVEYVNINRQNGSNYHDYHGQDHRANQDFDAWRLNLDAARIDVLWVFKRTPTIEREWVYAHAQLFPTIYEDESVRIVRVQGTGSDASFNTAWYQ